jgi:ferrochelatase
VKVDFVEQTYDAVLIVAFGGPEKKADVIPFLENVVRGRNVPRERMLQVAEHYGHFGGVSPINAQVRELRDALRGELDSHDVKLPIYWGNRNWHPLLPDTIRQMADDGIRRALAVVLAAYSSYSSCRQYCEDVERARQSVGTSAPRIDKVRAFYNHPDFVAANIERLRPALDQIPQKRRAEVPIAFTAHSIPLSMAENCDYEIQLSETCRLVSEGLGIGPERWQLVYQSRSGRPADPWLEPDVCNHLVDLKKRGACDVILMPIGFLSDHIEVLFDLDEEARGVGDELGLNVVRASSVGTHPLFVGMLRELIQERLSGSPQPRAIGRFGPSHDVCPDQCCPASVRPGRPDSAALSGEMDG